MIAKWRTLVANPKQYAMMRAMQDEEYRELHEVIEYMNERQERLTSTMERKQQLMGEVPEIREFFSSQEVRVLDDRISAEEVEKKQAMMELLKEKEEHQSGGVERHSCCHLGDLLLSDVGFPRKDTEDTDAAEGGVTWKAPARSRSSEAEW